MKTGTHIMHREEEREGPRPCPSCLWAPAVVQPGDALSSVDFSFPSNKGAEDGRRWKPFKKARDLWRRRFKQ